MGVIILPLLIVYLFGQCFDLPKFELVSVFPYENVTLDEYVTVNNIDTFTSEFTLYNSTIETAKFFGLHDVISWKLLCSLIGNLYDEQFVRYLRPERQRRPIILIKMNLKTIKKTIPTKTPQAENWEDKLSTNGGTHYLKSIAYGSNFYAVLLIDTDNNTLYNEMKRAVEEKIGPAGTFDETFIANLKRIEEDTNTKFRTFSYFSHGVRLGNWTSYLHNYTYILDIKRGLENGSIIVPDTALEFEFHSLSEISPFFPSIEVNSEIMERGKELQLKFYDLKYTKREVRIFKSKYKFNLTSEDYLRLYNFQNELEGLMRRIAMPIIDVDVSTNGDIHQFDRAFELYGSNDTYIYWHRFQQLLSTIQFI